MPAWIDSHNHLHDPRLGDPEPVIAAMREAGVKRCVVNATSEADWAAVAALASKHPDFVMPAFGIHPWRAHTATPGWETRLTRLLERFPRASIGECGLDGWVKVPAMEIQMPVFLGQLRLARQMDRPVTIHCLKAWQPLFDAFQQEVSPSRFLMHSFGGSIEIARRLLPMGAFFSFSGYFLHQRKSAVIEVFRQLPSDRILVETDAPDMLPPPDFVAHPLSGEWNHPANLPRIAEGLAAALGCPAEKLAELTSGNAVRCFGDCP